MQRLPAPVSLVHRRLNARSAEAALCDWGKLPAVDHDSERIDRELRQLTLMQQRVEEFRRGDLYLGRLIADLEGLLEARELAEDQWIEEFRSARGGLEISYAVALDRSTPVPDASDPAVADDLQDLDRLISAAIAHLT